MPQLPLGRRASAADFGAAEGAARAQQAGVVSQIAETSRMLVEADQSSRVSRAVAQAAVELDQVQAELGQDPDFTTHDERFEKARSEILERVSEGILPGRFRGELQDRLFPVAARSQAAVRDRSRAMLVDQSRARLDQTAVDWSGRAARAPVDSDARAEAFDQYSLAVRQATGAGLISAQDAMGRLRAFEREVSAADRAQALREDPEGAYDLLQEPESHLARGLSEVERQQAIDRAVSEHGQQVQQRLAQLRFLEQQEERRERELVERALRDADDLVASGDREGLSGLLEQTRDVLPPHEYRRLLGELQGTASAPRTVPELYSALSTAAASGEPVADLARALYRQGKLDQDDLRRIEKLSEDRRFGDVQDYLRGSLKQGVFSFDPSLAQKESEVLRAFSQWQLENPNARRDEALAYGRSLLRWAGVQALDDLPPTSLAAPTPDAAAAELFEAADRGEITPEELDRALAELEQRAAAEQLAQQPRGGTP